MNYPGTVGRQSKITTANNILRGARCVIISLSTVPLAHPRIFPNLPVSCKSSFAELLTMAQDDEIGSVENDHIELPAREPIQNRLESTARIVRRLTQYAFRCSRS